jgi:hypothetical protein
VLRPQGARARERAAVGLLGHGLEDGAPGQQQHPDPEQGDEEARTEATEKSEWHG